MHIIPPMSHPMSDSHVVTPTSHICVSHGHCISKRISLVLPAKPLHQSDDHTPVRAETLYPPCSGNLWWHERRAAAVSGWGHGGWVAAILQPSSPTCCTVRRAGLAVQRFRAASPLLAPATSTQFNCHYNQEYRQTRKYLFNFPPWRKEWFRWIWCRIVMEMSCWVWLELLDRIQCMKTSSNRHNW